MTQIRSFAILETSKSNLLTVIESSAQDSLTLRCRKGLWRFKQIAQALGSILYRSLRVPSSIDVCFIDADTFQTQPISSISGARWGRRRALTLYNPVFDPLWKQFYRLPLIHMDLRPLNVCKLDLHYKTSQIETPLTFNDTKFAA